MLLLGLAGCARTTPAARVEPPPATPDEACVAGEAQTYVGQTATPALADAARNAAGARAVRTIAPGTMVTMDYRADRLNLTVDTGGRVASVRCG